MPILPVVEARVRVVPALVLAVLVAEVVPVGAEIGQALGHRQVAVGDDRRHLLVDALVDLGRERVVPAADDDDAGRVLGALRVDRGEERRQVDRRRAGDPDLDVQRLARRLQARIDPLDEQRQVRGVADPDVLLVGAARVADRHVEAGHPAGRQRSGPVGAGCLATASAPWSGRWFPQAAATNSAASSTARNLSDLMTPPS